MTRRALTLASVFVTALAALDVAPPATAHADSALRPHRIPNKARELADRGRKHHDAGDYRAAVAAFKEAYVLAPSPGLLFNIAQAYRLAGKCDESAWMYRRFLDTDPRGAERRLAELHLATVKKCGNGGLRIEPPRLDVEVPEPPSELAIGKTTARSRAATYKRAGKYAAIGGGIALGVAGVFALDARAAAAEVERTYQHGGKWKDVADTDARGRRSAAIARVFVVGGGAAALSGAILYGLGRYYEQARHVAITPTTGGAQVSVSWGF